MRATKPLRVAKILSQLEIMCDRIVWLLIEVPRGTDPALDGRTRRRHCSNARSEEHLGQKPALDPIQRRNR